MNNILQRYDKIGFIVNNIVVSICYNSLHQKICPVEITYSDSKVFPGIFIFSLDIIIFVLYSNLYTWRQTCSRETQPYAAG